MTKETFTQITSNWDSHRPLLWAALEATKGIVVEMGMGYGSTPFLSEYCQSRANRDLVSYENNPEWFKKFNGQYPHKMYLIDNWDTAAIVIGLLKPSVLFIDHAPGERRKIDIQKNAYYAEVIICHDTEPAADHGYKMRAELKKFKYMIDYETDGAWASAASNFIDVTLFDV